jgi:cobalamin biosynthesis Mg chelatase CobN
VGESQKKASDLDELDAGWEDEDEDEDDEQDDIDAGWGDPDAIDALVDRQEAEETGSRTLSPEEREARAARVAARKERLRAKAAAKAERRKARASEAASKQKKSAPKSRKPRPQRAAKAGSTLRTEEAERPTASSQSSPASQRSLSKPRGQSMGRNRSYGVAIVACVLVILTGGIALLFWTRR